MKLKIIELITKLSSYCIDCTTECSTSCLGLDQVMWDYTWPVRLWAYWKNRGVQILPPINQQGEDYSDF